METDDIESVFPEPLRAFLLLEKSSLPGSLRMSVLIQCNYVYDMVTVGTALRSAFSETELRRIDKHSAEVFRPVNLASLTSQGPINTL